MKNKQKKATTEINQNKTKMQNIKGEGGMAIAVKENLQQFVTKFEHVDERITIMHIKTQIQGKTMVILNTHAPNRSYAINIRKE